MNATDPQVGQKYRLPSGELCHFWTGPVNWTASRANIAYAPNALPCTRRQVMQWHRETRLGAALTSNRTAPQAHPPVCAV
jgi:hypothetical protein